MFTTRSGICAGLAVSCGVGVLDAVVAPADVATGDVKISLESYSQNMDFLRLSIFINE